MQTGFDSKAAKVTTSESGLSGSDFLKNARVDNITTTCPTTARAAQATTRSNLVIGKLIIANTGFAVADALNLDGILTLTLMGGMSVNTAFIRTDTLTNTTNKINTSILAVNHEFEALKLRGSGGAASIEVRARIQWLLALLRLITTTIILVRFGQQWNKIRLRLAKILMFIMEFNIKQYQIDL